MSEAAAKTTDVFEAEPIPEEQIEETASAEEQPVAEQEEKEHPEQQTDAPPQEPAAEQPAAPSPEEVLVKRKLEHLDRIEHFRRKVMEKKLLLMEAKEIAKERRKQLDSAMEDLLDEIGDRPSAQLNLPGVAVDGSKPVSVEQEPQQPAVDPEAWRAVTLVDAGIDPKIAAKLEEIDVDTVGKYSDWCNKGGRLIDVKGIGKAKVDKFEDQLEAFWKRWDTEQLDAAKASEGGGEFPDSEDEMNSNSPTAEEMEGQVPAHVRINEMGAKMMKVEFNIKVEPGSEHRVTDWAEVGDDVAVTIQGNHIWLDDDEFEVTEWTPGPAEDLELSVIDADDEGDDAPQLSVVGGDDADDEDDGLGDI